jgi:transposase
MQTEFYVGLDLHSTNTYVGVLDEQERRVLKGKFPNKLEVILAVLEPHREHVVGVVVESTYNWYWLVDGLMRAGFDVRLMNPTKASAHSGLKYTDDKHDARWIASLLALGILPEGHIMPVEERGLRDLLRRRLYLVHKRTAHLLSLKGIFARSTGKQVSAEDIQKWDCEEIREVIGDPLVVESITVMLPVVRVLTAQIKVVEKRVLEIGKLRNEFRLLQTAPGIGKVLSLTIMCETGDIRRFAGVGNYASYCRCVPSDRMSNFKRKGRGNRKNGNKYLSWAFSEAAHHAIRFEPLAKRYYDRKRARSHLMVASRALANKMARACYYVLRDQVPFDPARAFC